MLYLSMNTTQEYEIMLVNMLTGAVAKLYVYRINDIVYEDYTTGGVCLFFDNHKELTSVICSYDDITTDARDFFDGTHHYYAMLCDTEDELDENEIDELFYGIKGGTMNLIRIEPFDEIRLDICLN